MCDRLVGRSGISDGALCHSRSDVLRYIVSEAVNTLLHKVIWLDCPISKKAAGDARRQKESGRRGNTASPPMNNWERETWCWILKVSLPWLDIRLF